MSNATLVSSGAGVRPFIWGDPNIGLNYTAIATPSLGKYKDSIYTGFQAILTDTVAGPTATITIQGTNDALSGAGVLLPVQLTNGSATVTIPTTTYNTFNVLDGNSQPTGQRSINSLPYQSFLSVPYPNMWLVPPTASALRGLPEGGNPQIMGPLGVGMIALGATGLPLGVTLSAVAATSLTLSAAFTGTTGIYYITFANNYWNSTPLGTITLTGGTATYAADGFAVQSTWRFIRANVTAITGTLPQVTVLASF